jgi:hypothetical protein
MCNTRDIHSMTAHEYTMVINSKNTNAYTNFRLDICPSIQKQRYDFLVTLSRGQVDRLKFLL